MIKIIERKKLSEICNLGRNNNWPGGIMQLVENFIEGEKSWKNR
jgi:hypothetical protein